MSPREISELERALYMSRHRKEARDAILSDVSYFTDARREAFGAVTLLGREAFNRDIRKMTGKPEGFHVDRSFGRVLSANRELLPYAHFRNALVVPCIATIEHDDPEALIRAEGSALLHEYKQSLPEELSRTERERLARKRAQEIKHELFPRIRKKHIQHVYHHLEACITGVARKHHISVDNLLGVADALTVCRLALDYLTPFPSSRSRLFNSYADRMRSALHGKHGTTERERQRTYHARMAFLIAKAADRIDNTVTMYAANRSVQKSLAVSTLEKQLQELEQTRSYPQWADKQQEYARIAFAAVDKARRDHGMKTGDSFDQNINDVKNIVYFNAALKYAQLVEQDEGHDPVLMSALGNLWEELLQETAFHAKQHAYSLAVHGIREPTSRGTYRTHAILPFSLSFVERLALVNGFKEGEGWNRLDGYDAFEIFAPLRGVIQTDHLAEQRGREESHGYLYEVERYLWHALYYWKKAEDLHTHVAAYNQALHAHVFGEAPLPNLSSICAMSGSLSSLAEGAE
jgi:hypothetical protein